MRRIYYYQEFVGLEKILAVPQAVTHLIVSSIHFNDGPDGNPMIHLNDDEIDSPKFEKLWSDVAKAQSLGIQVGLMVGGAGGAYAYMVEHWDACYALLVNALKKYNLTGVDIDIEEPMSLENTQHLIRQLRTDFPALNISMAPLLRSLTSDDGGMGGFSYKDLWNSPEGSMISWFNVQSYYSYLPEDFEAMVANSYPPDKLVLGMVFSQFGKRNFDQALTTLRTIKAKYPNFGGAMVWEYFEAPPDGKANPATWAVEVAKACGESPKWRLASYWPFRLIL